MTGKERGALDAIVSRTIESVSVEGPKGGERITLLFKDGNGITISAQGVVVEAI